ncbi:cytochrome P450 [Actinacidiphila sp. ITFR-21]|uniref:cytochrome P450 n=1 Tax=Actinacidiphila sp. ITFR-21 TaxID=3075199 RepID=UPI002888FCB7|nr:cytochrome P450 [Streptomyces sp. ITFR-21]WNI17027.1 cytochrome P450 [Streptomyces sp. ITFR-21]
MADSSSTEPRFPFPQGPFGGEPREFAQRRAECPFGKVTLRSGHEAILALGYADIAAAVAHPRMIRSTLADPEAPRYAYMSTVFISESQRTAAIAVFAAYARELVAAERAAPGDGVLSHLVTAHGVEQQLSEEELLYIMLGVIATGTDTVTNALGRIMVNLMRDDRAQWKQVVAGAEVSPQVLEELLRLMQQGNGAMLRMAEEDVELPSGTIRAGETVVLPLSPAGLDPAVYPDPYALRFDRESPPRALVFGGGAHYCVGVHLGKAELQIAVQTLVERFPEVRPAVAPEKLRFSRGDLLSTLKAFPVLW